MRRYVLTAVTVLLYAGLLIWKFSGALTGNELLFSMIAFFIAPMAIMLTAGLRLPANRLNILPMAAVIAMQCLLPQIAFRSGFHIDYLLIALAAGAVGIAIGVAVYRLRKKHTA
ncbi:MAG: hypothetical protein IJ561_07210 [Ruminococcus sp.]|nr:hypothetical protein [Ruminococcus sp.]